MHNYLIIKYTHCKNGQETYFVVQYIIPNKLVQFFGAINVLFNIMHKTKEK